MLFLDRKLGEIITELLTFQTQYKAITTYLYSTIDDLIQVLKDNGIFLPKYALMGYRL